VTSAPSHETSTAPLATPAAAAAGERTGSLPHLGVRERARAVGRFANPAPGRHLAVEDGDDVVLVTLDRAVLHVGRSPSADIVLDHPTVSRRHAVLSREGAETVLLDDRSRNGVLVNGERVGRAALRDGDLIHLGTVALRYVEVPEDAAPAG
jgi:pSer/pThr/pTyr-binding forkhead associated (FHA) protein